MKIDLVTLRKSAGLNQTDFWEPLGVTQSGGARYEMGRRLPKPVQQLLRLVYIEKVDLDKIRRADMDLLAYLKSEERDTYKRLQQKAAAHLKGKR
jgi:transcriptional regulator with XRE-family HTH domain